MNSIIRSVIPKQNFILKNLIFLISISFTLVLFNCSGSEKSKVQRIVVGIPNDISTLNPLYAFDVIEGHLIDLLYLKPAIESWNDSLGVIEYKPMFAKKWEWNSDSSSITLYLRDDAYWSDNKKITAEDIVYSFDIYSDPKVDSRFLGEFKNFYTLDGVHIDTSKTFQVISPETLKINFKEKAVPDFLNINLEILPRHIWSKYKREELSTAKENFEPVTSGPFKLIKWERNSTIQLGIDSSSFLFNPDNINGIVFKIIPDYKSRITQLITSEIDLMEGIKSEDISEISKNKNLKVTSLKGREFDYIGWNHVDPKLTMKNKSIANKLFSSAEIRKALGYAINREEILNTYLGHFGEICNGPVSPIFKKYYDVDLKGLEYNPARAKNILREQGWLDRNNDGILEKGNTEFKFDLFTNSGNPRREYAATIIKNNLLEVGINVNVQILESAAFIQKLMNKEFDAWVSGWTIPLPMDLKGFWYSDKNVGIFNFSNYQNSRVDTILDLVQSRISDSTKVSLYKQLQQIFYNDQPITYLYWVDNIIVYNKKLSKIKFSILGLMKNAWEWKINN
jgi:peptide/nickel transport system substrate-binding protein